MTIWVKNLKTRKYEPLKTWTYPTGEIHVPPNVKTILEECETEIKLSLLNSYDMMEWLLVEPYLREFVPIGDQEYKRIKVRLGYLPYARDDKFIEGKRLFTLERAVRLIVSPTTKNYHIMDLHNPESAPFITNSSRFTTSMPSFYRDDEVKPDVVLVPDKGAVQRANLHWVKYGFTTPLAQCDKKRDREVLGVEFLFEPDPKSSYVIFDDICDGGGTFINIANQLALKGISKVVLCVTHGLFTNKLGIDHLFRETSNIVEIRYTNSLHQEPDLPMNHVFIRKR